MALAKEIKTFIDNIPKAELHVHLEGTIEAEMMFALAKRNGHSLKYADVDSLVKAYQFDNLRDFLYLFNEGTKVMRTEQDFFDVCYAYLKKAASQKIKHAEIFIDFQTYLRRGIDPAVQMKGLLAAKEAAFTAYGITTEFILCFLRHLGAEAALECFEEVKAYKDSIIGIGLASTEIGYPPEMFREVFAEAKMEGFKLLAHAGEEGPWEYVANSLDYLNVDRIDHGNRACQNEELTNYLVEKQVPLTICPLSNIKLKNVASMEEHTIKKMLDRNMLVTINSDDPAYFQGYVNENYYAVAETFVLTKEEIYQLACNSFKAAFLSNEQKNNYLNDVEDFYNSF